MRELKILKAFGTRKNYESTRRLLNKDTLSQHAMRVLKQIDEFYAADAEAQQVDWDIIKDRVLRPVEAVPKHKQQFEDYLHSITSMSDVSEVNVVREVRDTLLDKHKDAMVDAALSDNREELDRQIEQYLAVRDHDDLILDVEEKYSGISVADIKEFYDDGNRIRLGPRLLTDRLGGGLRRGHHLLLAARPEVGKSMFALAMAANVLRQGYRVLYIGNEDPMQDLIMRMLSNLSGMIEEEVKANPETAIELAREQGFDNCTFAGMAPGTIDAIGALCRTEQPDVLVIDQLRNLSAKTENNTQRLDVVARGARELGRKHNCAVISVTQAGDSAEGKLVLNMGDVDGSNTGIPGACDVMVMVGCNDEYYRNNYRTLSLPKNKIGRYHGSFVVRVEPTLSRVHSDGVPTESIEDKELM